MTHDIMNARHDDRWGDDVPYDFFDDWNEFYWSMLFEDYESAQS